jgi:hypothetical protein
MKATNTKKKKNKSRQVTANYGGSLLIALQNKSRIATRAVVSFGL